MIGDAFAVSGEICEIGLSSNNPEHAYVALKEPGGSSDKGTWLWFMFSNKKGVYLLNVGDKVKICARYRGYVRGFISENMDPKSGTTIGADTITHQYNAAIISGK